MLNQIKTILLLGILTGIALVVGQLIGGTQGLTIALVIVMAMNFFSYFFSDKLVLMMYRAKPLKKSDAPEIFKIVDEVRREAGIPMPKLYVIPTNTPNAFATGRNPKHAAVAVTAGIVSLLSKDELKGVLAHEISHVKNRDILITTIASTIAGVISYLAMMFKWAAIFGGGGNKDRSGGELFGLLALAIITPLLAMILQLAISRAREYMADESGARLIRNPKLLASALAKLNEGVKARPMKFGSEATSSLFIVNPFSTRGIFNLLSTHPPVEERIKRLNQLKI
jgi:heat shock protein HtpX